LVDEEMTEPQFSHLDDAGKARMVDVTPKEPTHRRAVARCKVMMLPATAKAIANHEVKKGDVIAVARVAGIQAAKRTSDMIPLCHPLPVSKIAVDFLAEGSDRLRVRAEVRVTGNTGVEMEALTAVSVAALTVYDMCKAIDKGMVIEGVRLLSKEGGKSGSWRRGDE
jgi:cyclic pyranopterin phosphate synthase